MPYVGAVAGYKKQCDLAVASNYHGCIVAPHMDDSAGAVTRGEATGAEKPGKEIPAA